MSEINKISPIPITLEIGILLAGIVLNLNFGLLHAQANQIQGEVFPGKARLSLPKTIYATEGLETNVYFDNIVLVANPANYIFDVTCKQGFQYDERWTYVPKADEVGEYPITIEVLDETNTVIARAKSTVQVAPATAGAGQNLTFLAIGDSHLQRDVYPEHILDLSKKDNALELTLVGCRGVGNKPPANDVRHEGYNGWTAQAFATVWGPQSRTGYYKRPETGSPFIYKDEQGKEKLDFSRYCKEFNNGKPPDFVTIQLAGNDIWRGTDETIDELSDTVLGYYDRLIKMIHDYDKETKVGIIVLDPLSRSQHGYRNYRGARKKSRWAYRRIQHRMVELMLERYRDQEKENIYLVPVNLNLDCVNGFPMRPYPLNSRMPTKVDRVYDGSHLSPEGYLQFGDSIYCWIKACTWKHSL